MHDTDVIVIGSGFGGAVTACRLAEAGYRVLILERGRRWQVQEYPSQTQKDWLWDHEHPERENGWIDLRVFPHNSINPRMAVVAGSAVGGGSLIYANISVDAKPDVFASGWPAEITFDELKPFYHRVGKMLDLQQVPKNQWPERTRLMQEAAEKIGFGDRFRQLDLAVSFDEDWHYGLDDPFDSRHSKTFTNRQGQQQGTCVHLGYCDIGCPVKAKNTLDLNYIPRAEKHGAEVRALHLVRWIERQEDGYRVHFERIANRRRESGQVSARIVIVAAGTMGTNELLLRCRDDFKSLPRLSRTLGTGWSSNGDFLTPAFHRRIVDPTRGPTITSAIDFLGENNLDGEHFFIEDGGFPDVIRAYVEGKRSANNLVATNLYAGLRRLLDHGDADTEHDALDHAMPWFSQGRDAANGTLSLSRKWTLFGPLELDLDWDVRASLGVFEAISRMHTRLAEATEGNPLAALPWMLTKALVTPHPLGGCRPSNSVREGVVKHSGEVHNYRNLYVADGAVVPKAIGANPSKTIAALAERTAQIIIDEGR